MFAIEITEDNVDTIIERFPTTSESARFDLPMYIRHSKRWYLVSGYVTREGKVVDWVIFPENMFRTLFDYTNETFDREWTQVTFDTRY